MHLDTVIYEDDTQIIAIPFGRRAPWLVMPTVFGGRLDLEASVVYPIKCRVSYKTRCIINTVESLARMFMP